MREGAESPIEATGEHAEGSWGQLAGTSSVTTEAGTAAGSETSEEVATTAPLDLEFRIAEDVLYHRARQGVFLTCHRWFMGASIVFGTAAAGALIKPQSAGIIVAALGAADLCFDLTGRAQIHADLARRYQGLARRLFSGGDVQTLTKRYFDIGADEPPTNPTARLVALNSAILSLGRDESKIAKIPLWRRAGALFFPI